MIAVTQQLCSELVVMSVLTCDVAKPAGALDLVTRRPASCAAANKVVRTGNLKRTHWR